MIRPNDICIVALGTVLPQANSPEELWHLFMEGRPLAQNISAARINAGCFYGKEYGNPEQIKTLLAAEITPHQYNFLAQKNHLSRVEKVVMKYCCRKLLLKFWPPSMRKV